MPEPLIFEAPGAAFPVKKPWERQEGEPARWYMRFKCYLAGGHRRSINAIYELEQQEKATRSRGKAGETWYNAAKRYRWAERADAWDQEQAEQKAAIMRDIASRCAFVSRPFRLTQLDALADTLMKEVEKGQDPVTFLAMTRQMQALMHDIVAEVTAWNVPIDASCDAAALDAFRAKQQRQVELQQERDEEMDYELDRLIEKAEAMGALARLRPDIGKPPVSQ